MVSKAAERLPELLARTKVNNRNNNTGSGATLHPLAFQSVRASRWCHRSVMPSCALQTFADFPSPWPWKPRRSAATLLGLLPLRLPESLRTRTSRVASHRSTAPAGGIIGRRHRPRPHRRALRLGRGGDWNGFNEHTVRLDEAESL